MADQVVEEIKKAKSSLKEERKPVSQVVTAQKATRAINEFVKFALAEENRWVLHPEEQTSIVEILEDINHLFTELYEKCRTPYHFQKNAAKFVLMQKEISHLVSCIHLSLDQGYYLTEPRGFSPGKAVLLSWQQIQFMLHGLESSGCWSRLPLVVEIKETDQNTVKQLGGELRELQELLKKNPKLNSFEQPLSIQDIQSVYQYFHKVHQLLEMEQKALDETLQKTGKETQAYDLEYALAELNAIEADIQRLEKNPSGDVPEFSLQLYQSSRTDAMLRLNLLRVPFEPLGMIDRHLQRLQQEREVNGLEESIASFKENHEQEIQLLQLFLETLSAVNETLHQVLSIMYNLSISFGKIYLNASAETITVGFLQRALGSVKGLLKKGMRVTGTRKDMLMRIQNSMQETELFDNPIVDGLFYTLDLLDEGREEMARYLEQLEKHINLLDDVPDWSSKRVYILLQNAYEQRTSLSTSAMIFNNVTQTCELFHQTLQEINNLWKRITEALQESSDAEMKYAKLEEILGSKPESFTRMVDEYLLNVQELKWVLDEMLISTTQEEYAFLKELREEMEPVKVRLQANKKKKGETPGSSKFPVPKQPERKPTAKLTPKKDTAKQVPRASSQDPFPPLIMEKVRGTLKNMSSEKGEMLYFVLTHTHMFFNLLDKLEKVFKQTEIPSDYQMEQTLMKSKTTNDFIINVLRMKFLNGGYYNPHNVTYDYDDEKQRFIINPGSERFLQLSRKTYDTPEGLFTRLVRILLGMEDSGLMNSSLGHQVVAIMDEDFKLSREEQLEVQNALS